MQFNLISPTNSQVFHVNWIEVQTNEGSFVIKRGHAPTIIVLLPNKELSLELADGSTTIMTISEGVLEVNRNSATLLLTQ